VTNKDRNDAADKFDKLEPWEQRAFTQAIEDDNVFYFVDFENLGGVPSPLMLHIKYEDGSERDLEIPAEIWRKNAIKVTHRLIEDKPIAYIALDTRHQTADANYSNNRFPSAIHQSRLSAYKADVVKRNLMADMLHELKDSAKMDSDDGKSAPLTPANGR
jgi:hypothetical protein